MTPRYGCHSRAPFIDLNGRVASSWPHAMAKDCQFTHSDLGKTDARCAGCAHKAPAESDQPSTQQ